MNLIMVRAEIPLECFVIKMFVFQMAALYSEFVGLSNVGEVRFFYIQSARCISPRHYHQNILDCCKGDVNVIKVRAEISLELLCYMNIFTIVPTAIYCFTSYDKCT